MALVVRISGLVGLVVWGVVAIAFLQMIGDPSFTVASSGDVALDRLVKPFGLMLGLVGLTLSLGILTKRVWAYRGVLVALWLIAAGAGSFAVIFARSWKISARAVGFGVLIWLLRFLFDRDKVRSYFGITVPRSLLAAPSWLHLGLGLSSLAIVWSPTPTPMFGVWLEPWQANVVSLAWGVSSLVLGWGLLKARRWSRRLTIALGFLSLVWLMGFLWNPNPFGRLPPAEAVTRLEYLRYALLGLVPIPWTLRRIWLQDRAIAPDKLLQ